MATHTQQPPPARDTTPERPHAPRSAPRTGRAHRDATRTAWAYLTPTLVVVGAVTVFPVLFSLAMSFSHVNLSYSGFELEGPTLDNYAALFSSGRWYGALAFTLFYTVVTVAVELALGTLVALVLERLTVGRGWLMALLLVPWAMITVVSAQLWAFMLNSSYGVVSWFFDLIGLEVVILGEPAPAIAAVMVADIWKTTPFVAIIVLAGLVAIPREQYEAASIDGANAWHSFWRITLPQLTSTLAIAVLFRTLQSFGVFDLPFVMTGGGPGTATEPLALLGWRVMFQSLNLGAGAAIAVTTGGIVLIMCLLALKVFRAQVGEVRR